MKEGVASFHASRYGSLFWRALRRSMSSFLPYGFGFLTAKTTQKQQKWGTPTFNARSFSVPIQYITATPV
jgi:hypothetical protein